MHRPLPFITLLLPLLLGLTCCARQPLPAGDVRVDYVPAGTLFANPERGFYHYLESRASAPTPYELAQLRAYREEEAITLVYCIYYLDTFVTSPIEDAFLDHIQRNLDTLRAAGLKCILRFAYTDDWNGEAPPFGDATKEQILAHIDQLAPILKANGDVIALLQAGFIGVWGEWYYTDHFVDDPARPWVISEAQWQRRHEVLARILQALPPSRTTAIRTAEARQALFGPTPLTTATAHAASEQARTGYHDDCFLASDTDYGTWFTVEQKAYMAAGSQFLPVGGESCHPNPPRSECATALAELARFHWSYLNSEYHPEVLASWAEAGCLEEITRRLGYRLQLLQGHYGEGVRPGHQFTVDLRLENVGYAAPFNPRPVELLLRHTTTGATYTAFLLEEVRRWHAGEIQHLDYAICTPADLPPGSYELLLNLPDPAERLRPRPAYALLLANGGGVPEPDTGYNNLLHTLTVSADAPPSPCAAGAIQVGAGATSSFLPLLLRGVTTTDFPIFRH